MNTFRRGASALISVSGRETVAVPAARAQRAPLRAKTAATSSAWLLFCLLFVSAVSAHAATFDIAAGDVAGFKAAINTANANGEADTINLAANATYTLTTEDNTNQGPNGLPVIVEDGGNGLSINGNGASLVRSSVAGTPDFRILTVFYRASLNVSGLTLSGGSAVDLGEALSGFGGAINNLGTLTMTRSTVSNNSADVGGGIHSLRTLQLSACTIADNTADSQGGGLNLESSTGTLENCTISGNKVNSGRFAGGGGLLNVAFNGVTSTLTLDSCTINNNTAANAGAGISNFLYQGTPNTTYRNTIIAGNSGASNVFSNGGSITSLGYNISSDASGNLTQPTDKPNTNPRLAPLANNGGPTQTHALQTGSPAIDAGNTALTTDQRGFKRPSDIASVANAQGGNGSDIGAFELEAPQSGPNLVVNQTDDHDDGTCGTTDCTLREAINAANVAGGAITFDTTVFASKQTLTLTLGNLPTFISNVTVSGPTTPGAGVTVKGKSAQTALIFQIQSGVVSLSDLSLTTSNVAVTTTGGTTTVERCTVSNSVVCLYNTSSLTAQNCTLNSNGGLDGVLSQGGTTNIRNCTVTGNNVGIDSIQNSTVNVSNSLVVGNRNNVNGPINDEGFNILTGTAAQAGLGPLKDNGGPTQTFALLAGSPAIDMGSNALIPAGVTTDQRGAGFPRIRGGVVDIGAYEVQNSAPVAASQSVSTLSGSPTNITLNATDVNGDKLTYLVVAQSANGKVTIAGNVATYTSNAGYVGPDSFTFKANDGQLDSNTATVNINVVAGPAPPESGLVVTTLADVQASDGVTSLREAVDAANRDGADSPITFAVSGTITLTGGELTLVNDGKVSITGPAKGITINGDGKSRVFNINGADATLSGLNITGGNAGNANGGGILNNGALTLNGSTLFGNAANSGGAIANGGALTLVNSTLAGNSAQNNGGGVFNSPTATMTSLNSTIVGNAATAGGGISKGKTLNLSNTLVVGNSNDNLSGVADAGSNNITAGTGAAAGLDATGLRDNGGAVKTIALTTRGTAVNTGDNNAAKDLKTDARGAGFPRIVSGKVDIGAFESAFGNRAPSLNNATFSTSANVPFSQQLAGNDADGDSLSYARAGGTLPAGITLSPTGLLAGTPNVAGRYDFSVNVFDGTDTIVARFIIVVSDITDGVGPVITRAALNASYTRDEFANIVYRGTVRDVAPANVTPSGVEEVTFQLRRNSDGFAYSGNETDGFTSNVNLGYFPAFLGAAVPDTTAGARDFRRTFGADGFVPSASVLKPGGYSLVIVAKDNAGNYSVEVVPVAITAATSPAISAMRGGADVSGGAS